jgi:UDP-3-O-[3-hydroxymyristoyl] glucosamine N-acyltransferase
MKGLNPMADARFFTYAGSKTLAEIIQVTGADVHGALPKGISEQSVFADVATLDSSCDKDVAVFHNRKYLDALGSSKAGIILVEPQYANRCPETTVVLISSSPYRAFAQVATAFYPAHDSFYTGSLNDAPIHPTAEIGQGCQLEAGVTIGENAVIGRNCFIGAHTIIGKGVHIGDNCQIASQVTITHAQIGCNVFLHTGVRVGQAGFGFHMDKAGHFSVPQLGRVIIHDYVDVGANTTIDRGSGEDTIIGAGCRIDNLVMIAHNVEMGRGCVIVAQVGISGSTKVGDYTAIGGQAGLAGHLTIGKGVQIAAQSGIMRNIEDGVIVGGSPAVPAKQWHRQTIALQKLANKQ